MAQHAFPHRLRLTRWLKRRARAANMTSGWRRALPPSPAITTSPTGLHGWFRKRRSEEHTSELQSLMRNSYAVFCLKKKNKTNHKNTTNHISHKYSRKNTKHK